MKKIISRYNFLTRKKDKLYRVIINYINLNKITSRKIFLRISKIKRSLSKKRK